MVESGKAKGRRMRRAAVEDEVWYERLDGTPVGLLWVAVSPQGVAAIALGGDEETFLAILRRRFGGPMRRDRGKIAPALAQLREYFAGQRRAFELPTDLRGLTPFQRRVLREACGVPAGSLTTYGEIARRLGKPRAARAVGRALAANPIPLIIPCHRVVAADGTLRGYSGGAGLATKARLLELEGAISR
jgi:methylated-DNA-[protein]-cysteine S-methyltransferase